MSTETIPLPPLWPRPLLPNPSIATLLLTLPQLLANTYFTPSFRNQERLPELPAEITKTCTTSCGHSANYDTIMIMFETQTPCEVCQTPYEWVSRLSS